MKCWMHTLTAIRLKYILPSQIFAECGEVTSLEIMLLHTWLPGSGVRWDNMKMIENLSNELFHPHDLVDSTQLKVQCVGVYRFWHANSRNVYFNPVSQSSLWVVSILQSHRIQTMLLVNTLLLKLVTLCIVSLHYWEVMNAADSTYNTPWSCRFLVMTHNYLITLSFEWLDKIQTREIPATSNTHNLNPFNIIRYSQG